MALRPHTVADALSWRIDARLGCAKDRTQYADWYERHTLAIREIAREYLPSGSGIDNATRVDLDTKEYQS